jgi:N-methylhydantoinase A
MRYAGQNSELGMRFDADDLGDSALADLTERFHLQHHAVYGYNMPQQAVEIVTLRLALSVPRRIPSPVPLQRSGKVIQALKARRQVWFPQTGFVSAPVYDRDQLPVTASIVGPCVVEQMDTTTVVPPQAALQVDGLGYLHIDLAPRQSPEGHHA